MRLNAEKERICHYREIAIKSAFKYYRLLEDIMEHNVMRMVGSMSSPDKQSKPQKQPTQKLEKKAGQPNFYSQKETKINCVYYITDYIKIFIENGNEFVQDNSNLQVILDSMIAEEFSDEVIDTLKLVIKNFEFDRNSLRTWIEEKVTYPPKREKCLRILEDFIVPEGGA